MNETLDPGAPPATPEFSDELLQRCRDALAARGSDYEPRTHHRLPSGAPRFVNRLIGETSPYLLQHAHNPVNWYPWGDEAFETARRLGRPVLLSVGYSTCHWCHVMEAESFEDVEVASFLNQHYVAVKVDREERPDVDAVYMSAVQLLTGQGGWPMTVWLTPDRRPFYGGTYFPARDGDRGTPMGFLSLLARLGQVYTQQPDRVANSARELSEGIRRHLAPQVGGALPRWEDYRQAVRSAMGDFDATSGGVYGAPKFPSSFPNRVLLRWARRTGDAAARDAALFTLKKMAAGGMYDHVAGGFHRYSTDDEWLVPHFEKMLYDNALLAIAYLEAWQVSGDPIFQRIAREIFRYMEREMTSPEGAFYSATDADSVGPSGHMEEGYYFTWTPAELGAILAPENVDLVTRHYAVTERGNFEGRNILHTPRPLEETARALGLTPVAAQERLDGVREVLFRERAKRPAPLRDEKIQLSWNALMISALARGGRILAAPELGARAVRAASFILERMADGDRLFHTFKDSKTGANGYLDDYAFFIQALIDLYEATGDISWLGHAQRFQAAMDARYRDVESGGYFMSASDQEELLARQKPSYDGAEPSGNSVAALNLLRLYAYTTKDEYRAGAESVLASFGGILHQQPRALMEMFLAVDAADDAFFEIVLCAGPDGNVEAFLDRTRRVFLPNAAYAVVRSDNVGALSGPIPWVAGKAARDGQAIAFVCENGVCHAPTSDPDELERQIRAVRTRER